MSNKSLISFLVLFGVAGSAIAADPCLPMQPPKVRNVAASQGVYDDYVHIFYDLTNPELMSSVGADCNITFEFWPDPNGNWAEIYSSFPNTVEPNTALCIKWNNPNDWYGSACKVRITAQETKPPFFMGQAESGPFRLGAGQRAPIPQIDGVTAKQRKDASKLVDIYYDLSADEPNYEYYVYVQISTDEGENFDVNAVGVSGDVGARQQADKEKHIIWNPAIDLGAEASEPNCMVKVSVHGFANAVSEVFGIESVGPGDLFGAVYDSSTGQPIEGAEVSVYDSRNPLQPPIPPMNTTDLKGEFGFTGLTAGEKIIIVVKAGCLPVWKTATVGEASRTWVNIAMCPLGAVYKAASTEVGASASAPEVVSVRGKYCGPDKYACYLHGISLQESFEVEINWPGNDSNEVHWLHPPDDPYIQPCSGDKVTRTFDMGNDIGEGSLEVMAVSQSGSESEIYRVNLDVAEPPPLLKQLIGVTSGILYIPVPTGEGFEYRILGLSGANIGAGKFEGTTTTNIPIFNKVMEIGLKLEKQSLEEEKEGGSFSGRLSGMITSDGKADMFSVGWDKEYKKETRKAIKGKEGLKLPFVKVSPRASVGFYFYWDRDKEEWVPGGAFELGCNFLYSSPPYVVGAVLGVPIYLLAEISLDLALNLGLYGWEPQWSGDFQFEPLGKGVLGAGIAKSVCVEGYLGGGFHSTVQFLPEGTWPGQWDKPYIVVVGGVRAQVGPFSAEMPMRHEWHNPSSSYNEFGPFQLLPREDYDAPDPCDFKGEIPLAGGTEKPFPSRDGAVFPYSVPDVVRLDDSNMLAVWINDDTSRLEINRTKLTYATYDGHDWSEPKAVDPNSRTADMNPQLISLGDGKAACIWQDAKTELSDNDSVQTFLSQMEIAVSFYDIHDGNWSEPTRLTDNDVLDYSPRIAAVDANDIVAVWLENEWNEIFRLDNWFMSSRYRGQGFGWSPLYPVFPWMWALDATLAYDGNTATYVYSGGLDHTTTEDQELYMVTYDVYGTGCWSWTQLTQDSITDAAPKLAYDPNGDLLLFWAKGDNINMARGTGGTIGPNDVARSTLVVRPGESMISEDFYPVVDADTRKIGASIGVKDFDLVVDKETGQMALVWSDVSQPYIDPNLLDSDLPGPNLLDPNHIDPNRLDPNLIDLNLFPVGYDIWVSYRDPNFMCWSLPRQLTWDDAVERFISGAFDPNHNLFCVYDKAQTDYNDVVEPFWTDNPSDPSFDPNFPKEVEVKGKPERGRSDLYYMSYRMGVDLSLAVEDLEIVPPNPLPGTEATIIAKIKNLGELPISNIKLDFLYVDPNIYSLGLDPNYWFLDPNDPNYFYADPNYYSLDPNYCFSEPNYSYLDPNNYVKLIYSLVVCEPNHVPGDFRVDRRVDIIDLAFFASHWLGDCTVDNNQCDGTDLYPDDMNRVNFRDFAIVAKNWETIAGPLCGGSEVEVAVPWPQLPEVPHVRNMISGFWTDVNDFWRKIYVVVSSDDDEQGERNTNNNTASCETMRPDLTVSEMTVQTVGTNDIITVRVANEGALKANAIKGGAVLRADNPNSGLDLRSEDIPEIAAGAYYDVPFTVTHGVINEKAYAIVDPNETVEEFNEDNNIRSVTIRRE